MVQPQRASGICQILDLEFSRKLYDSVVYFVSGPYAPNGGLDRNDIRKMCPPQAVVPTESTASMRFWMPHIRVGVAAPGALI